MILWFNWTPLFSSSNSLLIRHLMICRTFLIRMREGDREFRGVAGSSFNLDDLIENEIGALEKELKVTNVLCFVFVSSYQIFRFPNRFILRRRKRILLLGSPSARLISTRLDLTASLIETEKRHRKSTVEIVSSMVAFLHPHRGIASTDPASSKGVQQNRSWT